jgi:peptidoglycan hydrolase FlgJ
LPVNLSLSSAIQPVSTMATAGAKTFAPKSTRDVPKEFEAFVLQTFIQEMLPKDAEGVYGTGIAGDIWRSMLSEKLAFEVAERGGLGIADQVRDSQAINGMQQPGVTGGPVTPAPDAQAQSPAASEMSADAAGLGWRIVVERS